MDEPLNDENDSSIYDLMPDDLSESPDEFLERDGVKKSVDGLMDVLNPAGTFCCVVLFRAES